MKPENLSSDIVSRQKYDPVRYRNRTFQKFESVISSFLQSETL